MALTLDGLQNLLNSAGFRIEGLNTPTSPGQPQVFQIRPEALSFLPDTPTLPNPAGGPSLDIPPIPMPDIDIPQFTVPATVPPTIKIPPFAVPPVDIPPIPLLSTIPSLIPTADILNAAEQVRIRVDWQVQNIAGTAVKQDQAILWPAATGDGVKSVEGLAQSLQTTVMVLPEFVDLARDFPPLPVKTLYLSATVTLSHGDLEAKLTLARFPITVPAVPIPTLAVFFAKENLGVDSNGGLTSGDQFALIVVPQNSPIGDIPALRAIFKTLAEINRTVDAIKTLAGLAGDVLPALGALTGSATTLINALNAHVLGTDVGVAFAVADRISDLNDIDTIKRSFFHNDVEAEDTISSLVFVAPPGRQLLCRRDVRYENNGIRIETGDACIAIVNKLTKAPVAVLPDVMGINSPKTHQSTSAPALDNRFSSIAFL